MSVRIHTCKSTPIFIVSGKDLGKSSAGASWNSTLRVVGGSTALTVLRYGALFLLTRYLARNVKRVIVGDRYSPGGRAS